MKMLVLGLTLLSLWSCGMNKYQSQYIDFSNSSFKGTGSPIDPTDTNPPPISYKFTPLAWESKVSKSSSWSNYIFNYIQKEQPQMLSTNIASDVTLFCPQYTNLSDGQRLNFWGQFFAAVAKFESGWSPTSRMVETTMGTDPVTGRQVASEGLLQLSYQDDISYGGICGFNWNADSQLSDSDPRKTIFDPYLNLRCGIRIMARQLKSKGSLTLSSGVYWAVLKINGRYSKINEIATITQSLSFCK